MGAGGVRRVEEDEEDDEEAELDDAEPEPDAREERDECLRDFLGMVSVWW